MSEERKVFLTKQFVEDYQRKEDDNRAMAEELRALKEQGERPEGLERLEKDLADCKARAERLEAERDGLRRLEKDLADCKARAERLEAEREGLQSKNDALTNEVDRLGRECQSSQRQNRGLSDEVDALRKKCEGLKRPIEPGPQPDPSGNLEAYKLRYKKALEELEVAKQEQFRVRRELFECQKKLFGD